MSGSPRPHAIDTDFGARKVRSQPGTLRLFAWMKPLAGEWVLTGEHGSEMVRAYQAVETELVSRREPVAGGLTLADVVVLDTGHDLVEVVALGAMAEPVKVQHGEPPNPTGALSCFPSGSPSPFRTLRWRQPWCSDLTSTVVRSAPAPLGIGDASL